ncbi:MAG TPA: glycosyltransferase family 39 protein [Polyangiaceae bacterium]|nr:glycosyltransferase family 39 protein [Polyangiaceae bacterium]
MSESLGSAAPARSNVRAVGLLALLAWLLNLYFYTGYYASDDMDYLKGVQRLADLQPIDANDIAQMRLMVTAPAAFVYRLFGSITLTILSYTLYHPLLVVIAYRLGRLAFNPKAALLGAAIVALSPVYYVYGGAILPDNCLSLWLAVLLLAAVWTLDQARSGQLSRTRELAYWLAVGGATGLAYSAKEPGIVAAVPVSIGILCLRLQAGARWGALQAAVAYGLGVVGFVVLETLLLHALSGSWVVRLLSGVGSEESMVALRERMELQGVLPLARLRFWYSRSNAYLGWALWVVLLANLAAWPLLRSRGAQPNERRHVPLLLAFWLWLFSYLSFGTTNFSAYLPPPLQHPRYFSVCVLPAAVIAAAAVWRLTELLSERLVERTRLRRLVRFVPAALLAVWGVARFLHFEPDAGDIYRAAQTKAALAAFEDARRLYPKRPVVLSSYLARRLAPLLQGRGCSGCGRIITKVDSMEELPARPFVGLIATKQYRDTFGPLLTSLERSRQIKVEPIGFGTYRAPHGRRSELAAALYPLLGEFSEPKWPVAEPRLAVHLYLVSDGPAAAAAP